jgi:hypothetical protein
MKHFRAKIKATLIHTTLSLIAFSVVLYFMLTQWFPPPLFAAEGGWQALKIVLFVDIVLGPCLTFFVYSPDKSKLAITGDLTFVAIVQTVALIYGIQTAHDNRVIAISYLEHKETAFPVRGEQLELQELSDDDIHAFDRSQYPSLVYTLRPADGKFDEITKSAQMVLRGIQEFAQIKLMSSFIDHINELPKESDGNIHVEYEGSFTSGTLVISPEGRILDLINIKTPPQS